MTRVMICFSLTLMMCVSPFLLVFAKEPVPSKETLTLPEAIEMSLEELMMVSTATGTPRPIAQAPAIAVIQTHPKFR